VKRKKSKIIQIVRGILATPDNALDCGSVLAQLPAVVDAAIGGEDISDRFPQFAAHIEACDQCRRQFEELLEISQLAEAGSLCEPKRFPQFSFHQVWRQGEKAPSTIGRERLLDRFRQHLETLQSEAAKSGTDVVRNLIAGETPALALLVKPDPPSFQPMAVRAPRSFETRQLTYQIEPIDLRITLTAREFERHRFTVRALIEGGQRLGGLGVALLSSEGNEPLDCTRVDDVNTFSFHGVHPGRYSIRLDMTPEEAIYLTDVNI
jgi:hypothetical protein